MGYVIAFILAVGMVGYAKDNGNLLTGCLGVLILLGLGITALDALWKIIKEVVAVIWLPVLIIAAILVVLCSIDYLVDLYVSKKSTACEKIKELYKTLKHIQAPTNIDVTKKLIEIKGEELPEEIFFVECHNMVQSQLDLIKSNDEQYDVIKSKKEGVLQEFENEHSKVLFERYVINKYARKISRTINKIPDEFKAEAIFSIHGEAKRIQYSFDEIVEYNARYKELEESLNKKRQQEKEREAEQKRQEEQKKKEEAERQARKVREQQQRKEAIKRERSKLNASLRYDVLKRDNFRCVICGRSAADGVTLHVDHIKPVSKGGKTELNNLRTLCDYCNLGKSDKYDPDGMN